MTKIHRRKFIQTTGGGMAAILATGRAPAYAQASTLHWLRWNDFIPTSDKLLRETLLPEAERALGIKFNFETVNANDLQPRLSAAIQSGSGPDVVMLTNNHPHLYAEHLADLGDLAEDIGKASGGYYEVSKSNCHSGKTWIAIPSAFIGVMIAYRKSWFSEVGYDKFPETWEQYRDAGKKLKAKNRPIGQSLGQSFGDPQTFVYPLLWSFGGKEVEADGVTVAINSKETIESLKFMTAFWKEAHDETGLAWDDSSNNRAFLTGGISATLNGASIYIEATRKQDQFRTERGAQLRTDIQHAPLPRGPGGQFGFHTFHSHVVPAYSKNTSAAKTFLRWLHEPSNYERWFAESRGFYSAPTRDWELRTMPNADPVMEPFRLAGRLGLIPGYAGPTGVRAADALAKFLLINMYVRAIQGGRPEDAARWAEAEFKKVYV